jgi:phage gp29-like protein
LRYSIDTSALLDGWRRYYPPDVFPDVWTGIEQLVEQGEIRATEEVFVELEKRDDEIFSWTKDRKGSLFVPIDNRIQERVAGILAQHERLVVTIALERIPS